MKSSGHRETYKKSHKSKVIKKNKTYCNKGTWNYNRKIPLQNHEDTNEIIRVHRTQRTAGKGYWKIVPKDSFEVYKDRKKRQVESERNQNSNERSDVGEVEDKNIHDKKKKDKKRIGKKKLEIDKRLKKTKQKARNRKRRHRCGSCDSSYFSTSVTTSYTSLSEMEYE